MSRIPRSPWVRSGWPSVSCSTLLPGRRRLRGTMFPDLISIGPFTIHTYGFFVAVGFAVGILTAVKIGKSQGVASQQVMDMAFVMIVWAIIGSRLFYVFINFSYYKAHLLDTIK